VITTRFWNYIYPVCSTSNNWNSQILGGKPHKTHENDTSSQSKFFIFVSLFSHINIGEYRRGHWKWIIQRNWQHMVHKTMTSKTKT
jgi:hypothetical protein